MSQIRAEGHIHSGLYSIIRQLELESRVMGDHLARFGEHLLRPSRLEESSRRGGTLDSIRVLIPYVPVKNGREILALRVPPFYELVLLFLKQVQGSKSGLIV
jgi:hypothetical protein